MTVMNIKLPINPLEVRMNRLGFCAEPVSSFLVEKSTCQALQNLLLPFAELLHRSSSADTMHRRHEIGRGFGAKRNQALHSVFAGLD
jgi:hypothetical protein